MHIPIERLVGDYERGRLSRRQLITHLAGLTALAAATGRAGAAEDDPVADPTFAATDLNHIALRVTDLDRSQAFYAKHLGLRVSSRGETSCFMQCRERNFLAMFKADEPAMDHYCYSVVGYEAGAAVEKLEAAGLAPRRRSDRVYFDDPDGLEVQVAARDHGV